MRIDTDQSGNPFINVGNLRVSWIQKIDGDWAGTGQYLRMQAYRGDPVDSNSLHRGAELPIGSIEDVCELAAAITHLATQRQLD